MQNHAYNFLKKPNSKKLRRTIRSASLFISLFVAITPNAYAHDAMCITDRVVDGDTLILICNGQKERVRLLGVDTDESELNDKLFRDAKIFHKSTDELLASGLKAKEYVTNILPKETKVYLDFDETKRDKYNRLLAYVFLQHGVMLNSDLIKKKLGWFRYKKDVTRYRAELDVK